MSEPSWALTSIAAAVCVRATGWLYDVAPGAGVGLQLVACRGRGFEMLATFGSLSGGQAVVSCDEDRAGAVVGQRTERGVYVGDGRRVLVVVEDAPWASCGRRRRGADEVEG